MLGLPVVLAVCTATLLGTVIDRRGVYRLQDGPACIELRTGEAEVLSLFHIVSGKRSHPRRPIPSANDVTAFAWASPTQIVFSTSTIYGRVAGVFVYDLPTRQAHALKLPATLGFKVGWVKLESLSATSVTCWFADPARLDEAHLASTAVRADVPWLERLKR